MSTAPFFETRRLGGGERAPPRFPGPPPPPARVSQPASVARKLVAVRLLMFLKSVPFFVESQFAEVGESERFAHVISARSVLRRSSLIWRITELVEVRRLRREDIEGVVALQRACFPPPFPEELLWKREHIERHLDVFPEGQFVAISKGVEIPCQGEATRSKDKPGRADAHINDSDGQVIGSASSLIITEDNYKAHHDWQTTVGGHFLECHDPSGTTLYGVDISVHPDFRGLGVGRKLYEARLQFVRDNRLCRYATACRIPDFAAWWDLHPRIESLADALNAYCREVIGGRTTDRTLTPLLRYGLKFVAVIENYMEDEESANAAALLEWKP